MSCKCGKDTSDNDKKSQEASTAKDFDHCKNLKSVTFGTGLETVPSLAFGECTSLTAVDFGGVRVIGSKAFSGSGFTSLTIGGSVEKLEANAFSGNESLTEIVLKDSVKEIADGAFYQCFMLETVTIEADDAVFGIGACDWKKVQTLKGGEAARKFAEENGITFIQ